MRLHLMICLKPFLNLVFAWFLLVSYWRTWIFMKVFMDLWRLFFSVYLWKDNFALTSKAYFLLFESLYTHKKNYRSLVELKEWQEGFAICLWDILKLFVLFNVAFIIPRPFHVIFWFLYYLIDNIHWIIKKAREYQKNIYFCFIDYAKAFDCVDHNKL